jgi:hypothetical protein
MVDGYNDFHEPNDCWGNFSFVPKLPCLAVPPSLSLPPATNAC